MNNLKTQCFLILLISSSSKANVKKETYIFHILFFYVFSTYSHQNRIYVALVMFICTESPAMVLVGFSLNKCLSMTKV